MKIEKSTNLSEQIKQLPDTPGVYKYFDVNDELLYIGKAKSLKKRVSSYFNKQHYENRKTAVMVSKIRRIDFILVDSEVDALLLENSLIKEYQPRFNINLKDDKSYPFLKITKERFPRIFPTRKYVKDGSEYFGPYASLKMMYAMLDLIKQLYPLRTCNLSLTENQIRTGKFKVCLEFHIGNCKGPCEALQSEEDYLQNIDQIRKLLKGNLVESVKYLNKLMLEASANWKFEAAARYKNRIDLLENYQSKSTVVSQTIHDVDVFSICEDDKLAFVNFMKVANGMIIQSFTLEYKKTLDESESEILAYAIAEIRNRYHSVSKEIILPFLPDLEEKGDLKFTVPKSGDKKKLLELSLKNAKYHQKEKLEQYEKLNPELKVDRLLHQMKSDLRLKEPPAHIECFDNSNFHGSYPVSACVVFKNGKPSKKDYRHFNVREVEGPNDFATMKEILLRRYARLLEQNETLPQLVVVDGGKGQLSSAVEALKELGIYGKLAVIGIAKKLEEIYYPEDSVPLLIDKRSETLRIIQQMRDEAHRFGITHHRSRRNKGTIQTELTNIKGIGDETAKLLLANFKSVKKIKQANMPELEAVIGKAKALLILEYFKNESDGQIHEKSANL